MGSEQLMIDDFVAYYGKKTGFVIHHSVVTGDGDKPDLVFETTVNAKSYLLAIECKTDASVTNVPNYSKQLFGEILKNRKSIYFNTFNTTHTKAYGIFLNFESNKMSEIGSFLTRHIGHSDWINFGKHYEAEFVFLYDQINHQLHYCDWSNFLTNPTIVMI